MLAQHKQLLQLGSLVVCILQLKICKLGECRSHRLNEYSSRGHCIMTLQFETTPLLNRSNSMSSSLNTAGQPMKKYGKLVLVDLAGSERLKVSELLLQP